jgi:hypothetical protein
MSTFEAGEAAIAAWRDAATAEQNLNEATTRLRLIDELFFGCLGWTKADCESERRFEGKYTDYEFSTVHRALVVEAKRDGVYFELPVGLTRHQRISLRHFERYDEPIFAAIEQCLRYCQQRGTAFGAVCNGHQIIGFIASRADGVAPLDGEAVVFESPDAMKTNFALLWKCFSREGAASQGLAHELLPNTETPPPAKLSRSIPGYPGYKGRNALQTELKILADLVIEDVMRVRDEYDFLRNCYAPTGALSQYSLLSRNLLEARYSSLFAKATETSQLAPVATKDGVNPELLAKSLSGRPVLLVGDVGVGKTTFIRQLVRIEARDVLEKAIVLYLDFGSSPTLSDSVGNYVAREITRQLQALQINIESDEFVRRLYKSEVSRFETGIYGRLKSTDTGAYLQREIELLAELTSDRDNHLRRSLEFIEKSWHKQIVIFLDNVDQRPYEFQQQVFLVGNGMATTWPATVFISIRPDTFHKSRLSGTLSAYHPRAFTIAPPRLDVVIKKRLGYAIALVDGGQLAALESIKVELPTLREYLSILLLSFENRRDLIEFCDNMCGGNVRQALEFVTAFLGSGHVDTKKILERSKPNNPYWVSLHEFMRAVFYGDYEHYDPTRSPIVNVFDISTADRREHFLVPILLSNAERSGKRRSDGFVPVADFFVFTQNLGFTAAQIERALFRCIERHLLERPTRSADAEGEDGLNSGFLRISAVGAYYVQRMLRRFVYADAVVVDTPILDVAASDAIENVFTIHERLRRAAAFVSYLDESWKQLGSPEAAFGWAVTASRLRLDLERIRERLQN